ncbi:DUF2019 domain-containing protein [Archangium sp. Cb G35]|uniref:DUF2019 domain-containing protein n=1 Tax=Archangium sp. Cb G35 TaxID=1920190 RepID=UPI000936B683
MESQVKQLEELTEQFAHHTAEQTDAIFRGDARTGNRHAKQRIATFKKLRAHGNAGRDALAMLLMHPRMDVRGMAAVYLLRYRTAEAKAVLLEIAKGEGLAAFEASEALKRWEEGTWALDPAEDAAGLPEAPRPAPPSKRSRPRTERAASDRLRRSKRDKPGG